MLGIEINYLPEEFSYRGKMLPKDDSDLCKRCAHEFTEWWKADPKPAF